MDCGPATLSALLQGFGIQAAYEGLRDACQTDIDGTSIDSIEEVARQAGLDAEQVMVPVDHVLTASEQLLPAVAVVRNAAGLTHFVVIWRVVGRFVQVMDPARGRVWLTASSLQEQLVQHTHQVAAEDWHRWALSPDFTGPLSKRLRGLSLSSRATDALIHTASASPDWLAMAGLDATTRLMTSLVDGGVLAPRRAREAMTGSSGGDTRDLLASVPERYWSARQGKAEGTIAFRGAVLVRARRRTKSAAPQAAALAAALNERPPRPVALVRSLLARHGRMPIFVTGVAAVVAALGVVLEAVLLRRIIDAGSMLHSVDQRWVAATLVAAFALCMLLLEVVLARGERQIGSLLEIRLRVALDEKLPALPAAYFQSRPLGDMLERSHSVHAVRMLPRLGVRLLRIAVEMLVTAAALIWLNPSLTALVVGAVLAAAALPVLAQSVVNERDLKVRTHAGALARYQLDALRGRDAIEAHGTGRTIEREHDGLLTEWVLANRSLQRATLTVEALQSLAGFGLVAWFLLTRASGDAVPNLLLQAYWLLNLPTLGYELASIAREFPLYRSTLIRALEPIALHPAASPQAPVSEARVRAASPASIQLDNVSVQSSGLTVLDGLHLRIASGAHVAIVGSSGAGKSTLIGLLLGFHRIASGTLAIDGQPVGADDLVRLRADAAWIDPGIQLWDASMLENLLYGTGNGGEAGESLEAAGLTDVVAHLQAGLTTRLGENGAMLSAGEAQRVRFARGWLKPAPRLVLLDEPFLGLERERRRALLKQARQRWRGVTTLYVTHDVNETRAFDQVVVLDRGRVVEAGDPRHLSASSSRYRRLLQLQEATAGRLGGVEWRRLRVDAGRVISDHARNSEQTA